MFIPPPNNVQELMLRVESLAGMTLKSIADYLGIEMPATLKREKGWVGQLLEKALGADAGNLPEPDFTKIAVELKTLPVNSKGMPAESTYVCVVPLTHVRGVHWQNSVVKSKLNRVLWLPVETEKSIPLANRRVGMGILWEPDEQTEQTLANDFNTFMEQITLGEVESITAHQGELLQIRPKAANASALTEGIGSEGQPIKTLPRGFYLRPALTKKILSNWREQL